MADTPAYLKEHTLAGDALLLDLERAAEGLWQEMGGGERRAQTLVKQGGATLVLTAVRGGSSVAEHSAAGPATIQVLRGRITVEVGGGRQTLAPGEVLALGPGVQHGVQAEEDSTFLLTVVASDRGA